ncbi:Retrovirus-related Pol polyprotein from transposon TNT 1-94 [Eumeta japonica]|uniref:Retrovirus-related Pol polyprotein from transposon TNT 1-94 n=1 Tax=Eumeta variegata TaxID=151549 RepID=A0A4C1ZK24_EUMVA|nr:Retrovirus-related Pol polyprotein from transposon TNT 1-94 [Eumeta japonica]
MVCELCQKGKQSRLPFPSEGSRALNPLELIHSDVCGPMEKSYWAEAVSTAAYITNRCPTRALSYATPEEMWSGKKPNVSHLKIFGCEAMVKIPKEKLRKLDSKASKMIFIGYSDTTKAISSLIQRQRKE